MLLQFHFPVLGNPLDLGMRIAPQPFMTGQHDHEGGVARSQVGVQSSLGALYLLLCRDWAPVDSRRRIKTIAEDNSWA